MADSEEGAAALEAAPAPPTSGDKLWEARLLIHNIAKKNNVGTLLRSAAAFNVKQVVVAGSRRLQTFGNQNTVQHIEFVFNENGLEAAVADLRKEGFIICGVEIKPDAVCIHKHRFGGSTAFLLGNEGTGMTPQQAAVCDEFVYIPQYSGATASLNVAVAGSIVLHHFARTFVRTRGNRTATLAAPGGPTEAHILRS
eukprot:GHVU01126915.1.p3 GENE.GHVU01126915.1~~GHVU01126915.1.p3  ORF type:complete len:197 (-),score=32.41 GHVU01126915.1:1475-2065(-)